MPAVTKICIFAFLLVCCSQSDFSSDLKKDDALRNISDQSSQEDNADGKDSSEVKNLAHEPVMTGGAYLTCTAQVTDSDLPQTTCALSDGTSNLLIPAEYEVSFSLSNADGQDLEHAITTIKERTFWTLELKQAVPAFIIHMHINTGKEVRSFETKVAIEAYDTFRTALKTQALHLGDNVLGMDVTLENPESCRLTLAKVSADHSLKRHIVALQVNSETADVNIALGGVCGIEQIAYLSVLNDEDQEIQSHFISATQTEARIQMTLERGSYQLILMPEAKSVSDLDDFVLDYFAVEVKGSFLLTPL